VYVKIAICDDDRGDRENLAACLFHVCAKLSLKAQTSVYSCGEDFLTAYYKTPFDIVFMDIYMEGINGIDVVRSIYKKSQSQFIFTTVSREHAIEAFSLNASHYLLKPLTENAVMEAVTRCLSESVKAVSQNLEIKTNQGMIPIPMNNIMHIEVNNKVCTIHTQKKCYKTYTSLDTLFELLDASSFMRAQRSFIVNMHFIDSFYYDHIVLSCGEEIVLSRSGRTKLKNQYQKFLFYLSERREL